MYYADDDANVGYAEGQNEDGPADDDQAMDESNFRVYYLTPEASRSVLYRLYVCVSSACERKERESVAGRKSGGLSKDDDEIS